MNKELNLTKALQYVLCSEGRCSVISPSGDCSDCPASKASAITTQEVIKHMEHLGYDGFCFKDT